MFSWGNTTQDLLTFSLMALTLILMESSSRHILNTFKDIHQPMANNWVRLYISCFDDFCD